MCCFSDSVQAAGFSQGTLSIALCLPREMCLHVSHLHSALGRVCAWQLITHHPSSSSIDLAVQVLLEQPTAEPGGCCRCHTALPPQLRASPGASRQALSSHGFGRESGCLTRLHPVFQANLLGADASVLMKEAACTLGTLKPAAVPAQAGLRSLHSLFISLFPQSSARRTHGLGRGSWGA